MAFKSKDIYQEVTDKIVAELEKGAAPWVKPWRATAGHNSPANAETKRPYSGVNVVLLWMAMQTNGWATPRFLTFRQAKAVGGSVRKGEKGTHIVFMKPLLVKDKTNPEELRKIAMLKEFVVFNVAQCDGLPEKMMVIGEPVIHNKDERNPLIEEFITSTGAVIREGHGEAFFSPGQDFISMPAFTAFKSADHFDNVRFHELGHWTGHKSRLDRDFMGRFGDQKYAAEELVAELTAAFLCAEFDIDGDLRNAGYIANWIRLLKSDPKAIFTASAAAQKAVGFLRGLALAEEGEDEISQAA